MYGLCKEMEKLTFKLVKIMQQKLPIAEKPDSRFNRKVLQSSH